MEKEQRIVIFCNFASFLEINSGILLKTKQLY